MFASPFNQEGIDLLTLIEGKAAPGSATRPALEIQRSHGPGRPAATTNPGATAGQDVERAARIARARLEMLPRLAQMRRESAERIARDTGSHPAAPVTSAPSNKLTAAECGEIAELCTMVGKPQAIVGYLTAQTKPSIVREELAGAAPGTEAGSVGLQQATNRMEESMSELSNNPLRAAVDQIWQRRGEQQDQAAGMAEQHRPGDALTGEQIRAQRIAQFANPRMDQNPMVAEAERRGNRHSGF